MRIGEHLVFEGEVARREADGCLLGLDLVEIDPFKAVFNARLAQGEAVGESKQIVRVSSHGCKWRSGISVRLLLIRILLDYENLLNRCIEFVG